MAEANADAVRLVKPYVEKAIAAALQNAITSDNGAIKVAIENAISAHADKTSGVHGLT